MSASTTAVSAWGMNGYGQLGTGNREDKKSPNPVSNLSDIVHIAVGASHSLALNLDGTVWAWGFNYQGQLGDGTALNRPTPVRIGTATDWKWVGAGDNHTVAIKADGTLEDVEVSKSSGQRILDEGAI